MRCAVIADDLTGAADTAVEFAKRGYQAAVLLDWEGAELATLPVVALDTESRHLPPEQAYSRAYAAARALREAGYTRLYKKVDSAVRGNLGAEIDAVLDATGLAWAVVAPAFPDNGRTTVHGHQCDGGIPLQQTAFARDPRRPVRDSFVPNVISAQSRRLVGSVGLAAVRAGTRPLLASLWRQREAGQSILVVDAETKEDLRTIAEALERLPIPALASGSAGLAEFLACRAPMLGECSSAAALRGEGQVFVVAGSIHPRTRAQTDRLMAAADALLLEVPAEGEPPAVPPPSLRVVILRLQGEVAQPGPHAGQMLASRLARYTKECLSGRPVRGLVLVGGDTAIAVLVALEVRGLVIVGEVQPGVPLGFLLGGPHDGLPLVTKAGGFGDEAALLAAVAHLHGEEALPREGRGLRLARPVGPGGG